MPLTRPLNESVVVITGASSGIGACTALLLAGAGTSLVLNARDPLALAAVAASCERRGARVTWVDGDIAEPGTAARLADAATTSYGRLDGWVNNAAVAHFCALLDVPDGEFRRVFEVDVFGTLYGAQAAVPRMRDGGGGVLVNVASVLARSTVPWMGPYNAAKHAVAGLSSTLRQELRAMGEKSVSVCTLLPSTIDTPLFDHAGNRTGHPERPLPPAYRPVKAAKVIRSLLTRPRREAYVGATGRLVSLSATVLPGVTERILTVYGDRAALDHSESQSPTSGNLFTPHGSRPVDTEHGRR
jgi:NAD(P)-dependent dehydrogenase (short-subunit alcohol dehydrogenase family)